MRPVREEKGFSSRLQLYPLIRMHTQGCPLQLLCWACSLQCREMISDEVKAAPPDLGLPFTLLSNVTIVTFTSLVEGCAVTGPNHD